MNGRREQFLHNSICSAAAGKWRRFFTMMEMVFALGLMMALSAAFYGATSAMRRYRDSLMMRNEAMMILDNTVERADSLKSCGIEDFQKIFMDEFSKSGLSGKNYIKASCEIRNGKLIFSILGNRPAPLAELEIAISETKSPEHTAAD